jgi:hypothetical protein
VTFPATTLDLRVELAFGAGGLPPLSWTWTDVSSRLLAQSMSITRGQANESADIQPASLTVTLDSSDGALIPNNPMSPWWPYVARGMPLRVTVEGMTPALVLDGRGGSYASTPNHNDFDFSGDLDLRVQVQPDQWSTGITYNAAGLTLVAPQYLVTRWGTSSDLSWNVGIWDAGWPWVEWTDNGVQATSQQRRSEELVASLRPLWLAFVLDVNNDAGGNTTTFYRYDGPGATPPADVTTWTIIDQLIAPGVTSVHGGNDAVLLGSLQGGNAFPGRILAMQARNGINGTLVASPDFTSATPGATSITDSTGKTWTLHGGASISNRRTRFAGTVDEIVPGWPFGDNNPKGVIQPSEAYVTLTANDLVRRLGQGPKPLQSPLQRAVLAVKNVDNVLGYWPCEDGAGATHLAAALATHGPLVVTNVAAGADSTLGASAPLPNVKGGDAFSLWGAPHPGPATGWAVEWFFRLPTPATGHFFTNVMNITTEGSAYTWQFGISDTSILIEAFDPLGAVLAWVETGVPTGFIRDTWLYARVEAHQNGPGIDWRWNIIDLSAGSGVTASGSFSGALGPVRIVSTSPTVPADGYSFGHLIVSDGSLELGWLAGADTSWVGESAAHRFHRLCVEEGIPVEVLGDPSVWSSFRGVLAYSQAMGPQGRQTILTLLSECAAVDLGQVLSRRTAPGFTYRCRSTMDAQRVALALDAATNAVSLGLELYLDDQRLRNDVTVTSEGGSSARVVDQASIDRERPYEVRVPIAGVGGVEVQSSILVAQAGLVNAVNNQNRQQAGWRLHTGTWSEPRYPTVTIDLALAPQLIEAWHSIELGDRMTLVGLPRQYPTSPTELVIEAVSERLSPTSWMVELTCGPGGPWLVGRLDG